MSNLVKCQNCGKEIKNEDKRTEIFCSYCGAKVQIVTSADGNIDNNKIDNYLFLSREALKVKNIDEAYNYVNRVLEVDVKNIDAWYLKMEILGQMSILKDLKCEEVIAAGNKVIEFSDSLEIKLRVYRYYLDHYCPLKMDG